MLKNSDLRHYVNYFSDFETTTDAQLVGNEAGARADPNNRTA